MMKTKGYKQEKVLDSLDNCTIYKASKNGKLYLMHEFEEINESDEYTFKIRKKLQCSHLIAIEDQFEEDQNKYYISQFIEMDLLKFTLAQEGKVLPLKQALDYFAVIIDVIDEMHNLKLVYRNLRPEKIRIKDNQPYFYDFSLSQFSKRRERMFDVVGCASYLAPEFFTEDGYGAEVDIWAAGVMLFYLLVHDYPFKFKGQGQNAFKEEFTLKCGQGFQFSKQIANSKFNVSPLKGNKNLQDFFKRIFHINPVKRLTIPELKEHPLLEQQFPNQIDQQFLSVIHETGRDESLFLTKMNNFSCSKILHKEEAILDFIEQTSELFLLECTEIYTEELRYRAQFAVLKVGLIKVNALLEMLFGIREPNFKIDPKQWQQVRSSSALNTIKDKLERKKKILHMIFKNASRNVKESFQKDPVFYGEKIPQNFEDIKISYRGALSQMFEVGRKNLSKAKGDRKLSRKLTESMVRVIILFLVNRLFESQEQIEQDFQQYLGWSKRRDLEDLQDWIETEELTNLKLFMKKVTTKYL